MTSNAIKCIILDDEQLAIDTLKWQLQEFCDGIEILNTFTNPYDAQSYLQSHQIDLCFLDIDMPEMSGFDFLKFWGNDPPFNVIFATAYSEFAIQAFKVSALDYLLKPIDEEDLVQTIQKYQKQNITSTLNDQVSILLSQINSPKDYSERIALPTSEGVHLVNTSDINRLEADNNYTTVFLNSSQSILVSKTLKDVEKALDPGIFFRIHQSHTINLNKVKLYQRGRGGSVTLIDGALLPVSKNRKEDLLNKLGL